MIEKHGFALTRMEPRLTPEKIGRSPSWDKGGVDGRTREARIKTGRSRKAPPRTLR